MSWCAKPDLSEAKPPRGDWADGSSDIKVDWRQLAEHREAVPADLALEEVYRQFETTGAAFFAVLEGRRVLGLCSREDIGMRLGSAYGFALFHSHPVRGCVLDQPMVIRLDDPWAVVLPRVFARDDAHFWQDLLLVDASDGFLGLISTRAIVRLQNQLLQHTIGELRLRHQESCRASARMNRELAMARELQLAMFSEKIRPEISAEPLLAKGIRLDSYYAPLQSVSGDFFEVVSISETRVAVLIGDVMGHGMQAALVTAMMRALVQTHSGVADDPGRFLTALNRSFYEILESCHLDIFATALAVVVDSAGQTALYANAGHPEALHIPGRRGAVRFLSSDENSNDGPLGIRANASYQSNSVPLETGDQLLLYTDGLYEAEVGSGEILGRERLMQLVEVVVSRSGPEPLRQLVDVVRGSTAAGCFGDDVCLIAIQMTSQ